MARVQRFDLGTLSTPRETPQGFLIVDGYASRVGTYDYAGPDGSIRKERRLPADVFDPASLQTFMGAPFTDDHPLEFVTLENAEGIQVGTVLLPGAQDGDFVKVTCVITDAETIQAMRDGKRELSVGYTVEHDETPGVDPTYGPYDATQRNIVINHLALVDEGRAGPIAAVRMDGRNRDARFQVTSGQIPDTEYGSVCACISSRDMPPRDLVEMTRAAVAKIPGAQLADSRRRRRDAGTVNVGWSWCATAYVVTEEMSADALQAALSDAFSTIEGVIVNRCDGGAIELSGTGLADRAISHHHARNKPMANRKDTDPNMPPSDAPAGGAPAPAPAAPGPAATSPSGDLMQLMQQLVAAQARIEDLLKQLTASENAETAAEGRATEAEAAASNAQSEAAAAQTTAADAKAQAEKAIKDANDAVEHRVDARVKLLTDANAVLGSVDDKGQKIDRLKMSDREIKLAIIKRVDGVEVPETETRAVYIDALLDGAIARHARGRNAGERVGEALEDANRGVNLDTAATDEAAAAKKMRDRTAGAWRNPAPKKDE